MRFGMFWQTPGSEGSSVTRRHWETIEEIALGEQLGFVSAWLAESVFSPTRPPSHPLVVVIAVFLRMRWQNAVANALSSYKPRNT